MRKIRLLDSARTEPTKGGELPEITYLFSFAIILVVLGHSNIDGVRTANPEWYWLFRKIIYSFHMHLFMFVSGFLFIHTNINVDKFSWSRFMKKKTTRLMIPYFIILSLTFLPRVYMSRFTQGKFSADIQSFLMIFINPHYSPIFAYWFLLTLFIIFMFSGLFLSVIKSRRIVIAVVLTAALTLLSTYRIRTDYFCLDAVSGYLIYFWLGCLFYRFKDAVAGIDSKWTAILLFIALVSVNVIDTIGSLVPNILIRLIGISFAYFLALAYKESNAGLFKYIDGYSFQIYLLSWFFHEGVKFFVYRQMGLGFYAVFPLSFSLALVFPVIFSRLVEKKIPLLRPVFGR